jgi:hypothetical protein
MFTVADYHRILKIENVFEQILNRTQEILIGTRAYFSVFNRNSYTYQ